MSFSTLRALHSTIGKALDDLERLYKDRSQSTAVPLDFPRLDEPYYTSAEHSAAEELERELENDPAVSFASKQIVAACGQLSAAVNKRWYGLMESLHGELSGTIVAGMRFLEEAHVVEILREASPDGLRVGDIHRAIIDLRPEASRPDPTVFTPSRLGHILRLLATAHWLREVAPDRFANNRRSSYVDSGKSLKQLREEPKRRFVDTDGVAAFVSRAADTGVQTETSEDQESGTAKFFGPFNLAYDTQMDYFSWLESPGNEFRFERFGHAMTGTREWETKEGILYGYPWASLAHGSVLVDVAGGLGSTSLTVATAHPHIAVVVEDRPQVVEIAPSAWGSTFASLFESGRMSFRNRDIFGPWTPLPSGKIPDVFLIRLILHDWPDQKCVKILSTLRAAAGQDTKLVIGDMLLPFACPSDEAFIQGDSPLLPNLGVANLHGYLMDILMMSIFGAKERTVAEIAELALAAGWKVIDIRRSPGSVWAYTTAVSAC
ncbi:S-adenosyl-L-methionine-dependent methyltransferase [Trametes coccinea BRFM310]|uniref:S-adenosyl-L-methionine-dependent methyltransferase n=1 Tax=Trametes coccinea (strain BRFM310) TaxID=1353009 RepID=A0A1Y2IAV8_TRAC3|nr:S-adenosyl-L-methionine-dependent methyltransferase [Trametes coccinea BRFM310]